ncbi:lipolytic protein G-D-S-L family [Anaerobacillus sp. CMMVII]|uniref:GDSL-type esterase/lipase family protein n=1 Tax=Anaerobacillus sp. CMMVII TaxID=2755588 RepID=UPI0021B82CAF|nr:GDSL-type esterase/lipase family protein [Anaerobacillus sp. CMMVII]MCT8140011.1 lipolytic protein G-D-S-L family [Anaerobacillus sp. CMMVII]
MKTIYRSLVLLLTITLLFSTTVLAKNDNAKKSLLALGDSIPYGYNLGEDNDSPSKDAFPYLIGDDKNMRVRNLAVPGWRTDQLLDAVENEQKFRQAIKQADAITLNIGNNDLLQALAVANAESGGDPFWFNYHLQDQINKSNLFENLGSIVAEIRSLTDAPIVIYNVYNPFQVNDTLHDIGQLVLPGINQSFGHVISGLNGIYGDAFVADAYGAFGTNQAEYVIAGDIHPTVEGQKKLAEVGNDVLESLFDSKKGNSKPEKAIKR